MATLVGMVLSLSMLDCPAALLGPYCADSFGVPRYCATVWIDFLNGHLASSTRAKYAAAANTLYLRAERMNPPINLDAALLSADLASLEAVLSATREERSAVAAMKAAIRRGMTADIHAALGHRYARVTALAMKEIAAAMPTPLDARLLDLAGERSSYIKKALVALLADKPHPDHIAPLIRLAGDQWTPDGRHSDYEDDYPIARAAVDALAHQGPIAEEDVDRVYQIGLGASDPGLSARVFDLVASLDDDWRERLFELADAPGRGAVRRAAAQALLGVHDQVSPALAGRITRDALARRVPIVASRFALLLSVSADHDDVLHVARGMAGHRDRRVLLLLMIWASKDRDMDMANEIAALLPSEHVGVALARGLVTEPIEEAAIADLGEAVICKEALRWINPPPIVAS